MTKYHVKIRRPVGEDMDLVVDLPITDEDGAFILVSRGEGEQEVDMLGVNLHHGEVVAGAWPDGEEWVAGIRVSNPDGDNLEDPDAPFTCLNCGAAVEGDYDNSPCYGLPDAEPGEPHFHTRPA